MRINKDSLKARANKISRECGVSHNVIYQRFFFDAFLSRLAVSKHKDKFVLKGGLLLSSIIGVDARTTMDMDFYLKKVSMGKEATVSLVKEIASIDIEDDIHFDVVNATDIRNDDIYGGFSVVIAARLDNVRCRFSVDIATGDPIVPSERSYVYKCLLTGEMLPIKTYSLESVVSEKLETVLSKGIVNSRSKDYYDLYILRKCRLGDVDIAVLKKAFIKTCEYRKFFMSKKDAFVLLREIESNRQMQKRWVNYCGNVGYAEGIDFTQAIGAIKEWLEVVL